MFSIICSFPSYLMKILLPFWPFYPVEVIAGNYMEKPAIFITRYYQSFLGSFLPRQVIAWYYMEKPGSYTLPQAPKGLRVGGR